MKSDASQYQVRLLHGAPENPVEANADVIVEFSSGRRFGATFFTIANIQQLIANYQLSGECGGGRYFWAGDMIIVQAVNQQEVEAAVADLLTTNEFYKAFRELR